MLHTNRKFACRETQWSSFSTSVCESTAEKKSPWACEKPRGFCDRVGSLELAFLLEETARKILPEAVLTCCVSGDIHMGCGYYKWGSRDVIRYSDIDAASVCVGSHSAS